MKKLTKAFISTVSLIGAAAFAGSGVAAGDAENEPVPDAVYDVPAVVEADVAAGIFTTRTEPKPWQTEPSELMRVAESFTVDGNTISATMPNGAGVAMVTDADAVAETRPERSEAVTSANSSGSCTQSITAYEPSVYGSQTRGTAAFTSSTGCSDDGYVTTELWGRNCNLGCHWHLKSYESGTAYAGSTTYLTEFHCRDGSHDWHTSGDNFGGLGQVDSAVRYLTNFC